MKKVLLGVGAVLALALLVILGLAATKPATFRVERKATIAAPAATVFANLNDFHRWAAWSPWEKLDPGMKKQYSGSASGAGSVYEWQGNKDVGKGRMTITDSRPNDHVTIHLEFLEPFPGDNQTTFTVNPSGTSSEVSWLMTGPNSFMGKVMSVFADMDTLIGGDFQRGLDNLKQVSESTAVAQP
jgi:uncharacterized protein YndB with AHSA1/START domain